jgi:hypothetical protein
VHKRTAAFDLQPLSEGQLDVLELLMTVSPPPRGLAAATLHISDPVTGVYLGRVRFEQPLYMSPVGQFPIGLLHYTVAVLEYAALGDAFGGVLLAGCDRLLLVTLADGMLQRAGATAAAAARRCKRAYPPAGSKPRRHCPRVPWPWNGSWQMHGAAIRRSRYLACVSVSYDKEARWRWQLLAGCTLRDEMWADRLMRLKISMRGLRAGAEPSGEKRAGARGRGGAAKTISTGRVRSMMLPE